MENRPIRIFYCYAHEDDALREQLARHLSPLRRVRFITGWFNHDIQAGTDWEQESWTRLDAADIILLLISADFFTSDYCYTVEMQRAIESMKLERRM
jgi:TIR domain